MKCVDSVRSWIDEFDRLVGCKFRKCCKTETFFLLGSRSLGNYDVVFFICLEKVCFLFPAITLVQFHSIKDRRKPVFFLWIFNIYKFEQQPHYFQAEN